MVDACHRIYGYENLLVCDGAAVPANPGVNPSLTITALAERAMARVPGATLAERAMARVPGAGAPLELPEAARPADESVSLAGRTSRPMPTSASP
ncbi:MAG: GMC oxidoreductase [Solirubrobacterales bacterium]